MRRQKKTLCIAPILGACQSGSAVLFALFACLVALVSVQVLAAVVICAERSLADEGAGRELLSARDLCLSALATEACEAWEPSGWHDLDVLGRAFAGRLAETEKTGLWTLAAQVRDKDDAAATTSVLVERGRDGLDLPFAALLAERVTATTSREGPWLLAQADTDAQAAETEETGIDDTDDVLREACGVGYVGEVIGAVSVGDGCRLEPLRAKWSLDEGWHARLTQGGISGARCVVEEGEWGEVVAAPSLIETSSEECPCLIVVIGESELDLRDLGEVWGVIVADGGSVLLDGTVLHGAVYATDRVDAGQSGQVVFSERLWHWACDASLVRVRLVPGSRQEGI